MSDELTRLELEALKNALNNMASKAPPKDVPIPFSEKGCRRAGEIISEGSTANSRPNNRLAPDPPNRIRARGNGSG
jgi:hypothetical protein